MDQITSQLDQLTELSDEQVSALQESVVSEFDTVEQEDPTPESVDRMTSLADMLDTVRGEVSRREAQAVELSARAAEASTRVRGEAVVEEEIAVEPESDVVAPEPEPETEAAAGEFPPAKEEDEDEDEDEDKDKKPEFSVEESAPETDVSSELSTETITEVAENTEAAEFAIADEAPEAVEAPAEEVSTELAAEAEEVVADEAEISSAEDETPEAEASALVEVEAEASNTEETPVESETQEEATPVTAAVEGAPFEAPADRRPVEIKATVAPVAITAGADVPGLTAGSTINDMNGVASAIAKRIHTLRNVNGGDGEQHIVASITTTFPEERILTNDVESNYAKIQEVSGPAAIVAAGGHATPLEVIYDVFGFGTDVRPVRDSLPRFQADRGGIRYITPPVLSSYAGAVGVWTNTVDTTPGAAVKNSLTVTGAAEKTAVTDAITLQLQFGNLFSRAYPELVARHNELALIQHARVSEQYLLGKIDAASTQVTTASIIGFARDFLVQIKLAAAAYRSRHRIDPATQLRAIIPTWVYDAMAADLTLNMPGDDNLGVTRGEIDGFLSLSNVTLTASLDLNTFGVQGAGALLEFPDTFKWYIFSEGSFLFLDGGTLDLGIIRDSTLVGTNDYKMFVETFEGLAFVGIESLAITSTIAVNGAAAALRDTNGGVAAAAYEA